MISSLDNKKVKEWNKLKQKKYRKDSFLLFDEDLVLYAKEKNYLKTLIYKNNQPFEFNDAYEVSEEVFNKLTDKKELNYIGISKLLNDNFEYKNRILLLDHLQDPTNIGTIIKNGKVFGFDSIILSNNCGDIYNEKTINNSNKAIYDINIKIADLETEIAYLKNNGFKVYATGLSDNTKELNEVKKEDKMCFILGNEGSGVSEEIFKLSDETIKIPMTNIDSLNVSMAASIIMYEFRK